MGCDIHAVIECQKYGSYSDFADVNIARDYKLFSAIAFGDGGVTEGLPYPPRGLPSDHSSRVTDLFYIEADALKEIEAQIASDEPFEPEEIAKGWGDWAVEYYESYGILPGPDVHTPSWLRLRELEKALDHAGLKLADQSPEFTAVLATMRILSDAYGDENVRLVFWFDG